MDIEVSFDEITYFIIKKFDVDVKFVPIDAKSIEVHYVPLRIFPSIPIRFYINAIYRDNVSIGYDCGAVMSLIIRRIIAHSQKSLPTAIKINTSDKYINIHPQLLTQLEKVYEEFALSDIIILNNSVMVKLKLSMK